MGPRPARGCRKCPGYAGMGEKLFLLPVMGRERFDFDESRGLVRRSFSPDTAEENCKCLAGAGNGRVLKRWHA